MTYTIPARSFAEPMALVGADGNVASLGRVTPIAQQSISVTTTSASLASLLGGTVLADAINAGATGVWAWVETNDVRVNFMAGNAATNGAKQSKDNATPYAWDIADLTKISLAAITGTATVNILIGK